MIYAELKQRYMINLSHSTLPRHLKEWEARRVPAQTGSNQTIYCIVQSNQVTTPDCLSLLRHPLIPSIGMRDILH